MEIIKIIGDVLAAVAAALGLTEKYGWQTGGAIVSAVALILVIALKIWAKKDTRQEGSAAAQSVGDGAVSEGGLKFEGIRQKGSSSQSVGKGANSKKDMSFKDIHQED